MASQFAFSLSLERSAKKQTLQYMESLTFDSEDDRIKEYDRIYNMYVEIGLREFRATAEIMKKTQAIYNEVFASEQSAYWIGISPDTRKISLHDFSLLCNKFVKRAPVMKFKLAYEQRGKVPEDMGNGFHVHVMIWVKKGTKSWRSKGEILRDCQSTFSKCCVPECVQVELSHNPNEVIDKYLINYESKDDHKIATKDIDLLWRNRYNIKSMYEDEDVTLCLSSPKAQGIM